MVFPELIWISNSLITATTCYTHALRQPSRRVTVLCGTSKAERKFTVYAQRRCAIFMSSHGGSLPPDGAVPMSHWMWVRGLQHFREHLVVLPTVIGIGLCLVAHLILDLLLRAVHQQVTRQTAEVARPCFYVRRPTPARPTTTDSTVVLYPNLQLVKRHCHVCMSRVMTLHLKRTEPTWLRRTALS